jgi:hypothetical protein
MSRIALESKIARMEGLLATELDGELVLMSIDQGAYYGMEQTARRIWDLLEQPMQVDELCGRLSTDYQVDPEICQRDVLPFLEQLLEEGLIVVA